MVLEDCCGRSMKSILLKIPLYIFHVKEFLN